MHTVDPPPMPRWLAAAVLIVGGALGAAAAVRLSYDSGLLWLAGLAFLGVLGASGYSIGRIAKLNPGRSKAPIVRGLRLAQLLGLFAIAQLPAVAWRLNEGDPEIRAAKAYCEEIAEETWTSLDTQGLLDAGTDATVLPGESDLPRFVHQHGLWFGVRDGRAHMGFQRGRTDSVDDYAYDIDRNRWNRSRVDRPPA